MDGTNWLIGVLVFIYGLLFGSFYNVIIYRLPNDKKIYDGRSRCPNCDAQLKAKDLVPFFSWLFLGRKCAYCKEKISWVYPIVELITGVLFLLAYVQYGLNLQFCIMVLFWSLILIVAVMDMQHFIIMDSVLLAFGVPIVILDIVANGFDITKFYSAFIAVAVYWLIHFVSKLIYKEEVFGMGDVFFISIIAYVVGLQLIILTLFLPFYVAVFYIIIQRIMGKKTDRLQAIPFAPFMSISAFLLTLFHTYFLAHPFIFY